MRRALQRGGERLDDSAFRRVHDAKGGGYTTVCTALSAANNGGNGHAPNRLLLFQAREPDDPMRLHEVDCFVRHLRIAPEALERFDILSQPLEAANALLDDPSVRVFIGGSGIYSVSKGGPKSLQRFVHEFIPRLVASGRPTFGSCWGLHALAAGLGGRVVATGDGEVGTYEVRLSNGRHDPLFAEMPSNFWAQMGHNDWVVELPAEATPLCENDASPYQAVRFGDGPVYGLQFHAELSFEDNRTRFLHYLSSYSKPGSDHEEQLARFKPSPDANSLLERFRVLYCSPGGLTASEPAAHEVPCPDATAAPSRQRGALE